MWEYRGMSREKRGLLQMHIVTHCVAGRFSRQLDSTKAESLRLAVGLRKLHVIAGCSGSRYQEASDMKVCLQTYSRRFAGLACHPCGGSTILDMFVVRIGSLSLHNCIQIRETCAR